MPQGLFAQDAAPGPVHNLFPTQDPELVRTIVGASHANLAKVKELLEKWPSLANAAWDWGFGDWETALGAASHTGNSEIANLLMQNGARPDLFTHVMLGNLDAVKAILTAMPGGQKTRGPHGITLLSHAEPGSPTYEYLVSLGGADVGETSLDATDAEKDVYVGKYSFGTATSDQFEVTLNSRKILQIKRGQSSINLRKVEEHGFAPSGAPAVRIRFRVLDSKSVSLTVHDPAPILTATRV